MTFRFSSGQRWRMFQSGDPSRRWFIGAKSGKLLPLVNRNCEYLNFCSRRIPHALHSIVYPRGFLSGFIKFLEQHVLARNLHQCHCRSYFCQNTFAKRGESNYENIRCNQSLNKIFDQQPKRNSCSQRNVSMLFVCSIRGFLPESCVFLMQRHMTAEKKNIMVFKFVARIKAFLWNFLYFTRQNLETTFLKFFKVFSRTMQSL